MAPKSSCSHFNTFASALLCICAIYLSTGAFVQGLNISGSPSPDVQHKSRSHTSATPSPAPVRAQAPASAPASIPVPVQAPSPSPSPYLSPTPYLAITSTSVNGPESLRRRAARILGLILVSFVGMLQLFVVFFLFVKRRQMLKHMYGPHARRDPPHIWTSA